MRKLLILMLVLGVASMASAVPIITGPATITPGATNWYTLSGTPAESGAGFSGAIWLDFAIYPVYGLSPFGPIYPMYPMGDGGAGYNYGYVIGFVGASGVFSPFFPVTAGPWFQFDLMSLPTDVPGMTYSLDIADSSWTNILSSTVVTVIPEPATIALLGLGSLFLMRRRRK